MPRKEKTTSSVATEAQEFSHQRLTRDVLHHLLHTFSRHGFQPIIPHPLEDKGFLEQQSTMAGNLFGEYFHEIANYSEGAGKVFTPTQIFNAYRQYLNEARERGPFVSKWFYVSPVLTGSGDESRLRHELGAFVFGKKSGMANAQLISSILQFLGAVGIEGASCEVNNIGCSSCRKQYHETLESHLVGLPKQLCANCAEGLNNSLHKVFSCQQPECREILAEGPQVIDFLDEPCREQLVEALEMMDELEIPYVLNPTLVTSPLTHEVLFRVGVGDEAGGMQPIWQGGDYSEALAVLNEEDPGPAIGGIAYLEDLLEHVPDAELNFPDRADVCVISLGDHGAKKALKLYHELSSAGVRAAESMLANTGIKDQLKEAKRFSPALALIIGQKEALDDTVILRDMVSSMQEVFTSERIIEEVKKRLGN